MKERSNSSWDRSVFSWLALLSFIVGFITTGWYFVSIRHMPGLSIDSFTTYLIAVGFVSFVHFVAIVILLTFPGGVIAFALSLFFENKNIEKRKIIARLGKDELGAIGESQKPKETKEKNSHLVQYSQFNFIYFLSAGYVLFFIFLIAAFNWLTSCFGKVDQKSFPLLYYIFIIWPFYILVSEMCMSKCYFNRCEGLVGDRIKLRLSKYIYIRSLIDILFISGGYLVYAHLPPKVWKLDRGMLEWVSISPAITIITTAFIIGALNPGRHGLFGKRFSLVFFNSLIIATMIIYIPVKMEFIQFLPAVFQASFLGGFFVVSALLMLLLVAFYSSGITVFLILEGVSLVSISEEKGPSIGSFKNRFNKVFSDLLSGNQLIFIMYLFIMLYVFLFGWGLSYLAKDSAKILGFGQYKATIGLTHDGCTFLNNQDISVMESGTCALDDAFVLLSLGDRWLIELTKKGKKKRITLPDKYITWTEVALINNHHGRESNNSKDVLAAGKQGTDQLKREENSCIKGPFGETIIYFLFISILLTVYVLSTFFGVQSFIQTGYLEEMAYAK